MSARICEDPTREEMEACLASHPFASEHDPFEREEAMYWFASNWHGGQGSNLYMALSSSGYKPGLFSRHVDRESVAGMLYEELESVFVTAGEAG